MNRLSELKIADSFGEQDWMKVLNVGKKRKPLTIDNNVKNNWLTTIRVLIENWKTATERSSTERNIELN